MKNHRKAASAHIPTLAVSLLISLVSVKALHLGACWRRSFTHRRCKGVTHTWLQFLSFHLELSDVFAGNGDLIFTQSGPRRCLSTWPWDQYHFSSRWNVYRGPICSLAGVTHDRVPISSANLLADDKTSLCLPSLAVAWQTPKEKAVKVEV